jgi:ribosomal protein S21
LSTNVLVRRRKGESIDHLLQVFKQKVNKSRCLNEFKDHESYQSKGQKERAKNKAANSRATDTKTID